MAAARIDKDKHPKGTFGLWLSSKLPVVVDDSLQQSPSDSTVSDGSPSDSSGNHPLAKGRFKARFRRSGSKLLSLLGIRGSWNGWFLPTHPGCTRHVGLIGLWLVAKERPTECGIPLDASPNLNVDGPTQDIDTVPADDTGHTRPPSPASPLSPSGPCKLFPTIYPEPWYARKCNGSTFRTSYETQIVLERASSLAPPRRRIKGASNYQFSNMEAQEAFEADEATPSTPLNVRRTKSSPGFANRVSEKLSSTFGKSTVIHRAHLKSRPSIQIVQYHAAANAIGNQGDSANDSTDPSTPTSCSGSPTSGGTKSTPPTSEDPSPNRSKSLFDNESQYVDGGHVLSPIRETPDMSATIATVEATANAKIYFETRFDDFIHGPFPREHRKEELLAHMRSLPLTVAEQEEACRRWYQQESDYLRQCRVLKSSSNMMDTEDMVSHAGYEPIEVLGRGSFGVVRLVREKREFGQWAPENLSFTHRENESYARRKVMVGVRKDVYAMKIIRKSEMIRNSQEGHVRAERDLLAQSDRSKWIVPLIASFQDRNNLYLIMDYMVGGDFLGLLIRKNILPESVAKWYIAEMLLCLEETHRLCWIHRDVKPDNFLISPSGHLKISDFGLAFNGHWAHDQNYYNSHRYDLVKLLDIRVDGDGLDRKEAAERRNHPELLYDFDAPYIPGRSRRYPAFEYQVGRRLFAKSVVGTSQYMAPEVIKGEHYDGRCDWWSFGIILFEVCLRTKKCWQSLTVEQCLYGYTPFACENRQTTKLKILVSYPLPEI